MSRKRARLRVDISSVVLEYTSGVRAASWRSIKEAKIKSKPFILLANKMFLASPKRTLQCL